MSDVTAVPLRPIKKGSLTRLWIGIALVVAAAVALAWVGTAKQVAMAEPYTAFLERNAGEDGVTTTASGLQIKITTPADGPKPTAADAVVVEYEGRLVSGEVIDSSARHGGRSTFPVTGIFRGWTEALQMMSKGSTARIWLPPYLASAEPVDPSAVPPTAPVLVFDITLVDILPAPQAGAAQLPADVAAPDAQ